MVVDNLDTTKRKRIDEKDKQPLGSGSSIRKKERLVDRVSKKKNGDKRVGGRTDVRRSDGMTAQILTTTNTENGDNTTVPKHNVKEHNDNPKTKTTIHRKAEGLDLTTVNRSGKCKIGRAGEKKTREIQTYFKVKQLDADSLSAVDDDDDHKETIIIDGGSDDLVSVDVGKRIKQDHQIRRQ